jgi:hypothetical protein
VVRVKAARIRWNARANQFRTPPFTVGHDAQAAGRAQPYAKASVYDDSLLTDVSKRRLLVASYTAGIPRFSPTARADAWPYR